MEPIMAKPQHKPSKHEFRHVALDEIVGKTIQGIARTTVEGANGDEPCVMLFFSDGTRHGFVLPADNQDEQE
jgi:hypothetical protein